MADADSQRCVSALLNGITQRLYYGNTEITEEFLKNELYAEMTQDEFRALHDKMRSLLKVLSPLTLSIAVSHDSIYEYCCFCCKIHAHRFHRARLLFTKTNVGVDCAVLCLPLERSTSLNAFG